MLLFLIVPKLPTERNDLKQYLLYMTHLSLSLREKLTY